MLAEKFYFLVNKWMSKEQLKWKYPRKETGASWKERRWGFRKCLAFLWVPWPIIVWLNWARIPLLVVHLSRPSPAVVSKLFGNVRQFLCCPLESVIFLATWWGVTDKSCFPTNSEISFALRFQASQNLNNILVFNIMILVEVGNEIVAEGEWPVSQGLPLDLTQDSNGLGCSQTTGRNCITAAQIE